jgi:hypothetical protein
MTFFLLLLPPHARTTAFGGRDSPTLPLVPRLCLEDTDREQAGALFEQIFDALCVQHSHGQVFEFCSRPACQPLLSPSRHRAEALLD